MKVEYRYNDEKRGICIVNPKDAELCQHINADFTMCNRKSGYASSTRCKAHFRDINCDKNSSDIQMDRLMRLRGVNMRMALYTIPLMPVSQKQYKECRIKIKDSVS